MLACGPLEDGELFDAWKRGDGSAGQTLIERHYDAIERFFRTKAGNHADELVQRTFLGCVEARDRFRGDTAFRSFLFGIARNILFEHIRGQQRDRRVDADFTVSSIEQLQPGVSTIAFERAEQRLLVDALRRLPLDIQICMELYYWEDVGVGELGSIMGIPAGTVKSRLHRGRTLLREAMEKLPADTEGRESVRALVDNWANDVRARLEDV